MSSVSDIKGTYYNQGINVSRSGHTIIIDAQDLEQIDSVRVEIDVEQAVKMRYLLNKHIKAILNV